MTSVASFIQYIRFEKRFSVNTVTAYQNDLDQFLSYAKDVYGIGDPAEIQHGVVRSWIVQLMEQKISTRSINRKITSLKTFYKFLLRKKEIKGNPMLKVQAPKTSKRLPVFVDQNKMDLLFRDSDFGEGWIALRDKLLMELLYATGMRLSELIGIKDADIDPFQAQLKVLGKRNKERIIPFSDKMKPMLSEYVAARNREVSSPEAFFVTEKGKPLYPKLVYRIVTHRLGEVTTLEKRSPHILRHTFEIGRAHV